MAVCLTESIAISRSFVPFIEVELHTSFHRIDFHLTDTRGFPYGFANFSLWDKSCFWIKICSLRLSQNLNSFQDVYSYHTIPFTFVPQVSLRYVFIFKSYNILVLFRELFRGEEGVSCRPLDSLDHENVYFFSFVPVGSIGLPQSISTLYGLLQLFLYFAILALRSFFQHYANSTDRVANSYIHT